MSNDVEHNKFLIHKYPWLWPNDWHGNRIPEDKYDYTWTFLDEEIPNGWRESIMEPMCEEIQTSLIKHNCVHDFNVLQIKEKFGYLHFYYNGIQGECAKEIRNIVSKYEKISYMTCSCCGKQAKWMSKGWICPYCDECAQNLLDDRISKGYIDSNTTIDKAFSPIESSD